jgi:hypothetical protein
MVTKLVIVQSVKYGLEVYNVYANDVFVASHLSLASARTQLLRLQRSMSV